MPADEDWRVTAARLETLFPEEFGPPDTGELAVLRGEVEELRQLVLDRLAGR